MKKVLQTIAGLAFAAFFVWWVYFYYSNCVFSGETLANVPSWCIAIR